MMGNGGPALKMPYYKVHEFLQEGSYDADADARELERVTRDERYWSGLKKARLAALEKERINGYYCTGGHEIYSTGNEHKCPYRQQVDNTRDECLCCNRCMTRCQNDADQEQREIDRQWRVANPYASTATTTNYTYNFNTDPNDTSTNG